jgi:hypothetical protein
MKNIHIAVLINVILYLTSCAPNEKFYGFEIQNIEGTKQYVNYPANPSEMRFLNNKLVWLDYTQNQMVYSIPISFIENEIENHNINKGFGPGEFGNILSFKAIKDNISFYDGLNKSLYSFNLNTPIVEIQIKDFPHYIIEIIELNSDRYLISGMFTEHRFLLINGSGEIKGSYGIFPEKIEKMNHPVSEKNMGCVNVVTATGNGFASIVYDSGIIEFFTVRNDSIVKVNEIIYSDIDFEPATMDGITSILRSNKNTGFIDVVTHKNKVFGLYSAVDWATDPHKASHAEYIFIYDNTGIPLKALKLQYPLQRIAIDPDSDIIYGFGSDENGLYFASHDTNQKL